MSLRGVPFLASPAGTRAALVVHTTNRRLGFTSLVPATGSTTVTLNGSLECLASIDPAARAACG